MYVRDREVTAGRAGFNAAAEAEGRPGLAPHENVRVCDAVVDGTPCGERLRDTIVWFGERLPMDKIRLAQVRVSSMSECGVCCPFR